MSLFPLVTLRAIPLAEANASIEAWGHKMGQLNRPAMDRTITFGLFHESTLVACCTTSRLITEKLTIPGLDRENTCELSRLCAARSGLSRVMLRLWREFIFPNTGFAYAISYQDSHLHSGNTYRFDGWRRVGFSHSGTDRRTGRRGRDKYIWLWPNLNEFPEVRRG